VTLISVPNSVFTRSLITGIKGFSYCFTCVVLGWVLVVRSKSELCTTAYSSKFTLPVIDASRVQKGYTLITSFYPLNTTSVRNSVYLMDMWGHPVHFWKTRGPVIRALLQKNGDIYVFLLNTSNPDKPGLALGPTIQLLSWNGELKWEYHDGTLTHDFDLLPNGNLLLARTIPVPLPIAKKIRFDSLKKSPVLKNAFADTGLAERTILADEIYELTLVKL